MTRLPILEAAIEEIKAAVTWYERERAGVGYRLYGEIQRAIERAGTFPQSGARDPEFDDEGDVRRFMVRTFPYIVVTALIDGERTVVAVSHASRKPGHWHDRVR